MKNLLITLTLLLLATACYSMPAATTDYFGKADDQPTSVMAVYYEEGIGFAAEAGVTVPMGKLFGLGVYEIPAFQTGDQNTQLEVINLAFLYGLGKAWYLGPIVAPVGIDWRTDVESGNGDPIAYIKASVGGIVGKSFNGWGIGLGGKYLKAYDESKGHWQGGLFLTANL